MHHAGPISHPHASIPAHLVPPDRHVPTIPQHSLYASAPARRPPLPPPPHHRRSSLPMSQRVPLTQSNLPSTPSPRADSFPIPRTITVHNVAPHTTMSLPLSFPSTRPLYVSPAPAGSLSTLNNQQPFAATAGVIYAKLPILTTLPLLPHAPVHNSSTVCRSITCPVCIKLDPCLVGTPVVCLSSPAHRRSKCLPCP